jgi:hypothetical protein
MNKNPFHRPDETAESRLLQTKFAVEANNFEQFVLWSRHSKESPERTDPNPMQWQQVSPGWVVTVGTIDDRPCNISMTWNELDGMLVCFYYACSQVVDHKQIEAWLEENFKGTWGGGRRATCDASNFHHCLDALKQALEPT